jgi:hypothetical protein
MKLQLDVEVRTNGEGKLEVVSAGVAKLADASEKAGRSGGGLSLLRGGLDGIASALAGAGVVAGLAALTRGAISAGDELWTMHERTGLAVETLSALKFHGDAAGTSLDAIARGMQFASRNAIEAVNGNEQAAASFQKLGISIDDLKRLTPEQLFERISKGMAGVDDQGLRTALAMNTLGRGGMELMPILNSLAEEGFDGLSASAGAAGAVMSGRAAEAADAFGDTIDALKKNIQAGIMVSLAELAGALGDDLPDGTGQAVIAFNPLTLAIKGVTSLVLILINTIKGLGSTIGGLADMAISVGPKLIDLFSSLGKTAWEALKAAFTPGSNGDAVLEAWARTGGIKDAIVSDVMAASEAIDSEVGDLVERTQSQLERLFDTSGRGGTSRATGGGEDLVFGAAKTTKTKDDLKERLRALADLAQAQEKLDEQERERQERSDDLIQKSRDQVALLEAQAEAARAVSGEEQIRAEWNVRNLDAMRKYRDTLREIEADLAHNKITPEAAGVADFAAYQQLLADEAEAHRQFQDGLTAQAEQGSADRLAAESASLERWKQKVDEFGRHLKDTFRDAIDIALTGGDVGDILDSFFDSFLQKSADALAEWADTWIDTFSSWALGETPEAGPYKGQAPSAGQQRGAQIGMGAVQGSAALYGMYNNPGASKGQNMITGAMSGAGIGAMYGNAVFPGYGAIVGALVGAIIGAFMPTEEGKNIRITGGPGGISISGIDDWGAQKALRSINAAIDDTAAAMDAIMFTLPMDILEQLDEIRPDRSVLTTILGKADGKNWTEELENFIRFTVPNHVMKAYEPLLFQALTLMNVQERKIAEIFARADTLDPAKGQALIKGYVEVIVGMQDAMDFLRKSLGDKRAEAFDVANQTPVGRMQEIDESLTKLGMGFMDLPLEEQISRGQQIISLLDERYATEIQYLAQIRQLQDDIGRSVEAQLFEIAQTQRSPEEQIDALLTRQRGLFTDLDEAKTPEEVARIMGDIQRNAGVLYDLMGRTPEAAAQITAMLTDANTLAQQQLDSLAKSVDEIDKLMTQTLTAILNFLMGLNGKRTRSVGKGGGGTPPEGGIPNGPDDPFYPMVQGAKAFGTELTATTIQVENFGTALDNWSNRFNAGTLAQPQFSIVVNVGGSLAGVVRDVTATIEPVIDNRAARSTARARSASGGLL